LKTPRGRCARSFRGRPFRTNVCISAADIDGDGQLDLALGAAWKPSDTKGGGTLQWLKRGKTLDDPWTIHPIDNEPTLHRIRFADLDGSGKPKLLAVPLFGRGSSKEKNWMDTPVRVLAYSIPKDPLKDRWTPEVLDESMHVMHNFAPIPAASGKGMDVLTASYEGVHLLSKSGETMVEDAPRRRQPGHAQQGTRRQRDSRWVSSRAANATSPPSNRGTASRSSFTRSRRTRRRSCGTGT